MILRNHEPTKLLQTLGGDLPICRIDPGPKTYPSELKHAHNHYKNTEHKIHIDTGKLCGDKKFCFSKKTPPGDWS